MGHGRCDLPQRPLRQLPTPAAPGRAALRDRIFPMSNGASGVYPMHKGAKVALYIAGALMCLMVITIRVGVLSVPIHARGLGGVLARKKCGGDNGVNLCVMDERGKTRKFLVSMFEN